jgi:acyl dehydratase
MRIEEFYVGQSASLKKVFSSDDVKVFAELSLDKNPIHLDETYAGQSLFGKRIVHGFFVGSLISAVFGTVLPGEGAIYLHQEMNFRKPVYHGEEIKATVTVTNIKKEKSILYFDTKCENERGEIVIDGNAVLKV